jgi:hypothetical protein
MAKHEDFAHKTPTDDEQMAKHEDLSNNDLSKASKDHAHDKNHDHSDAKANDEEGKMLKALKK